jgi:hypothetical protein
LELTLNFSGENLISLNCNEVFSSVMQAAWVIKYQMLTFSCDDCNKLKMLPGELKMEEIVYPMF